MNQEATANPASVDSATNAAGVDMNTVVVEDIPSKSYENRELKILRYFLFRKYGAKLSMLGP
jgi:hypothetical protein